MVGLKKRLFYTAIIVNNVVMRKLLIDDKTNMLDWDWEKNNLDGLNPSKLSTGRKKNKWFTMQKMFSKKICYRQTRTKFSCLIS